MDIEEFCIIENELTQQEEEKNRRAIAEAKLRGMM
jgi:hypothetical protein